VMLDRERRHPLSPRSCAKICAASITSTSSPTCAGNGALSRNGDESAAPGGFGLSLIRLQPRSSGSAAPSNGAVTPEQSESRAANIGRSPQPKGRPMQMFEPVFQNVKSPIRKSKSPAQRRILCLNSCAPFGRSRRTPVRRLAHWPRAWFPYGRSVRPAIAQTRRHRYSHSCVEPSLRLRRRFHKPCPGFQTH
jgi:hypothetical protein